MGQKIVGLSVGLLSLMLAASLYSWFEARKVRDAVADFTATLAPLSREASAIETHALEEALMLERAIRQQGSGGGNEMARVQELHADVEARLKAAEEIIATGIERSKVLKDAVALARIEPEIAILRREHAGYISQAAGLYQASRGADAGKIRTLAEKVSEQEDRVDAAIDRIAAKLSSASEDEASGMAQAEGRAYLLSEESIALALLVFLTGALVSTLITRRMVRPVRALIRGAEQVAGGNLDVSLEVTGRDEIGRLSGAFQRMIVELRTKERIKSTFGKYLDPRVVDRLLLGDGQAGLATGEKRVMTVFFSDLEGFSGISESLTASGLVNLINHYLTLASEPIVREQGVIDKYIGDAVMAFWGPPFYEEPDYARRACVAALAQQDQLAELRRMLPDILGIRRNLPHMNVRIGLSTGELIVGSIGSNISKSFTVMGDTVNTASRLEGANKYFGTHILIDGPTRELVADSMETREMDYIAVVGKSVPLRVYELLGQRGQVEAVRLQIRDLFEAGLAAYRGRDWDSAARLFTEVGSLDGDDTGARVYLARIEHFRQTPPDADWDGVWRLSSK